MNSVKKNFSRWIWLETAISFEYLQQKNETILFEYKIRCMLMSGTVLMNKKFIKKFELK